MLLKFLKRLGGRNLPSGVRRIADEALLAQASAQMAAGEFRAAIRVLRQYLRGDPYNVRVLNDLGACLAETGDATGAFNAFELAHSLDDAFIPAMVNHANLLLDQHRAGEALEYLRRAKICEPGFRHTDAVYGGLLLRIGETKTARAYQQNAWMGNFDGLRAANAHLFWMGYDDVDEALLAAEHRFWAETLKPAHRGEKSTPLPRDTSHWSERRIRIGYWSPDLRSHAVRYFFRPLLEAHDRERFEIHLYHDYPGRDAQTDLIEAHSDAFHLVHALTDGELCELIRSHDLDILVDLAGHTSHNRVSLLQSRMAPVQMNAFGYPPTTGLRTVDAKLIDARVLTSDAERYYSERPVALPSSFWCFDPMEDAPVAAEPPQFTNGHVTFGAVGNIAKITQQVARAWVEILSRVPQSQLLIRSVSFADPMAIEATRKRLATWGLPMERVDFRPPQGGPAFYASYNEIDIILDTFPFNGGTTTCFATYMGVPVVTVVGKSLIGRMGYSILSSLGADDLATHDVDAYIARAIELAGDREIVRSFKQQARQRYKASPLGNGKLFAREYERSVLELLEDCDAGRLQWPMRIAALPRAEIIRRAYATVSTGQIEATERILDHCLREYPDAGSAHILRAQMMVWSGHVREAIDYLTRYLVRCERTDQASAWLAITRMWLLLQDQTSARAALSNVDATLLETAFDQAQMRLYAASVASAGEFSLTAPTSAPPAPCRVHFIVPCDSLPQFEVWKAQVQDACVCPPGWTLSFERCNEAERITTYMRALNESHADMLVWAQKNVEICQPAFLARVAKALASADCISFAGASRWERLDWRMDSFDYKAAGFLAPSTEISSMVDVHVLGHGDAALMPRMEVLDGSLLVMRASTKRTQPIPLFDEALLGGGILMEEAWTHSAAKQGWRLAVHRNLGVMPLAHVELDQSNRTEARIHCNELLGFDPFAQREEDHTSVSAPCPDRSLAMATLDTYFAN